MWTRKRSGCSCCTSTTSCADEAGSSLQMPGWKTWMQHMWRRISSADSGRKGAALQGNSDQDPQLTTFSWIYVLLCFLLFAFNWIILSSSKQINHQSMSTFIDDPLINCAKARLQSAHVARKLRSAVIAMKATWTWSWLERSLTGRKFQMRLHQKARVDWFSYLWTNKIVVRSKKILLCDESMNLDPLR